MSGSFSHSQRMITESWSWASCTPRDIYKAARSIALSLLAFPTKTEAKSIYFLSGTDSRASWSTAQRVRTSGPCSYSRRHLTESWCWASSTHRNGTAISLACVFMSLEKPCSMSLQDSPHPSTQDSAPRARNICITLLAVRIQVCCEAELREQCCAGEPQGVLCMKSREAALEHGPKNLYLSLKPKESSL